jgi:hemolysin D
MKKFNSLTIVESTNFNIEDEEYISSAQASFIYGGLPNSSTAVLEKPTQVSKIALEPKVVTAPNPPASDRQWSLGLQNLLAEPPATFPRFILLGGLVFFLAFGTWAWLGRVQDIGQARGRLVPQGEVYKLNPTQSGKAVRLAVQEGDAVKAGQRLVELDTTEASSEVVRLQQQLAAYEVELSQKQGLIAKNQLEGQKRIAIALANVQSQQAAIAAVQAKAATIQKSIALMQTEMTASQTRLQKLAPLTATSQKRLQQLQADVAANQARITRLRALVDEGAISREYLFQAEQSLSDRISAISQSQLQEDATTKERLFQAEQSLRDRLANITQNQGELQQTWAQKAQLQAELSQKQAEASAIQLENQQQAEQMQLDLSQLKAKIAQTQNLLSTAQTILSQRFIVAPVDGVVSFLSVRNPGEFVQTGQTVAEIAPRTAPLVLAANLPNQEAGFVKVGMEVQVKLDAYPYQDFGIVTGKVTAISPDTKADKQQGEVYRVEVNLERSYITANHQTVPFKAGQTATADIVIRRRRIADLLFDPIKQLQKDGLNL